MLSMPTKARMSPRRPEIRPLSSDLPLMLEMMLIPKNASANVSGALNLRAMLARVGAMKTSIRPLIIPPVAEAMVEMPKALPASPRFVIG